MTKTKTSGCGGALQTVVRFFFSSPLVPCRGYGGPLSSSRALSQVQKMSASSCSLLRRRPRALIGHAAAARAQSSDVGRLPRFSTCGSRDSSLTDPFPPSVQSNYRCLSSSVALDLVYERTCRINVSPSGSRETVVHTDDIAPGIAADTSSLQAHTDTSTDDVAPKMEKKCADMGAETPLSTEVSLLHRQRGRGLHGRITEKTNMAGNDARALLEAADLLLELIKEKQEGNVRGKIKAMLVNRLLSAAVRCGKSKKNRRTVQEEFVVQKLEKIRVGLEELAKMKDEEAPFDIATYNTMATLWASSDRRNAPKEVKKIIACAEDVGLAPNTVTYYYLLRALVNNKAGNRKDKPIECEAVLQNMKNREVDRTLACFNACLSAWAKSGRKDAPQRGENMLISMQKQKIQPNFVSFTTVIDCLGRSMEPNAAERAEDLLRLMAELDASGMPDVRPTAVTYNSVINAHSKRATSIADAERADALLQEMKYLSRAGEKALAPDRITYSSCINAYSKVNDNCAARRSVELLREITELYENKADEGMAPDHFTYNAVLRTLGRQVGGYHADMAKSILDEMVRQYTEEGNEKVKPDIISFNSVIRSCSLHNKRSKSEKQAALRYALETLADIRNNSCGVTADKFTFTFFFRVVGKSVDSKEQAEKLLRSSFKWCCETGNLSSTSLKALKMNSGASGLPEPFLQAMLGTEKRVENVHLSDLPSEWSRNTKTNRK